MGKKIFAILCLLCVFLSACTPTVPTGESDSAQTETGGEQPHSSDPVSTPVSILTETDRTTDSGTETSTDPPEEEDDVLKKYDVYGLVSLTLQDGYFFQDPNELGPAFLNGYFNYFLFVDYGWDSRIYDDFVMERLDREEYLSYFIAPEDRDKYRPFLFETIDVYHIPEETYRSVLSRYLGLDLPKDIAARVCWERLAYLPETREFLSPGLGGLGGVAGSRLRSLSEVWNGDELTLTVGAFLISDNSLYRTYTFRIRQEADYYTLLSFQKSDAQP